jgi:predicted metal-binding protein
VREGVSTLFVCVTCRREGDLPDAPRPGARLYAALKDRAADVDVVPVECLSNCTRSCSTAVAAPGKWTYVVGDLDPERNADDLLTFARAHTATSDGLVPWRERPVHVRQHTIARVPPLRLPEVLK